MTAKRRSSGSLRALCARPDADDGLNPRFDDKAARPQADRKALQLCKQVADAVAYALQAESRNPFLRAVRVAGAEPAPDASRIRVLVSVEPPDKAPDALRSLRNATGFLRSVIAERIHRRRTPQITFALSPGEEEIAHG